MPRQQRSIQTSREGRLSLAIASYHNNPKSSIYSLAKAYDSLTDVDFHHISLTCDEWQTLYSPRVARIHHHHL
ncbi:hypothetical protein COCSADRAFT_80070 [Bipolaris sorokiniana ND90Pr]|uniref:Uncharacterized protein n=1 Tax=Cochliobolus sativus (strain ND90Pr / ATCC 201652) TaxID=665912 RepID=M2QUM4_COCSN|nr:uncharacterized protein COCSADRAFT_80070 [Bipolaris sorokiniana ND90Pr]XP_007705321.1 uncharacterized protein COCSADRAFT_103053 [Bipolaris sorokiniana ND90Pr]EMD58839.1 hypothetical protein COCSADRAFT_103053 [Bipolaris sorokiniana ND90Pr]EMD68458.1 hypothetical protein COCSADRAFT_80070 [Bipolaris sorokiniana ND90Pr]